MYISKTTAAILGLILALASQGTLAAERYKVSATLTHDGKLFGTPALVVKAGMDASVVVSRPNGYTLRVNVTDADHGKLRIVTHLDSVYGSMAPTVMVLAGTPATVSVDGLAIGITASRIGS